MEGIRIGLGKRKLRRSKLDKRKRKGSNFDSAKRVGVIYHENGPDYFKEVKSYVKYLRDEHGMREVIALAFINLKEKAIPTYHAQKLDFQYFCKDQLGFSYLPKSGVTQFVNEEFDILIDLCFEDHLPLHYVLKHSKAKMKIGLIGKENQKDYDVLIDLAENTTHASYVNQVNHLLTNFEMK